MTEEWETWSREICCLEVAQCFWALIHSHFNSCKLPHRTGHCSYFQIKPNLLKKTTKKNTKIMRALNMSRLPPNLPRSVWKSSEKESQKQRQKLNKAFLPQLILQWLMGNIPRLEECLRLVARAKATTVQHKVEQGVHHGTLLSSWKKKERCIYFTFLRIRSF